MNLSSPTLVSPVSATATPAPRVFRWPGYIADDGGSTFHPHADSTLTATPEELHLSGPRGEFHVPRSAIVSIGRGRLYPWFFCALQVHHRLPRVSRELQFKPVGVSRRELREQLRALGYPVR